ncbi:hypothetical protein C8R47DRAFT_1064689 [Mycena vitilis]|nr:hypothetical protein C8R47DRAFT_1064689 [Mycena vitilis]
MADDPWASPSNVPRLVGILSHGLPNPDTIGYVPSLPFPYYPDYLQASILSLPDDGIQLILSWASPSDIQNLREAGRPFQQIIDGSLSSNIWRYAFQNVLFPLPLSSTFLASQIATFAFRGGLCYTCRAHTFALPYSFSLNVRFCSLACEYATLRTVPPAVNDAPSLPTEFVGLEHHSTLPVGLPYLEGSQGRPVYEPRHVERVWNAFFDQCRAAGSTQLYPLVTPGNPSPNATVNEWVQTAEGLCVGARRYRIKKEQVDLDNYAADLEVLDIDIWERIRPVVLGELIQRISFHNQPLSCPFCLVTSPRQRKYKEESLHAHIIRSHPQHVAEPIAIPGVRRCSLCPPSNTTTYDRRSLLRHVEDK